MTTLHGGLTNHNPLLPTTENTSPTSQGRIAIAPTTRTESANLWKTFTAFLRSMRGTNVTVLEDVDAKAATRARQHEQIWIQSTEINSDVFDL